MSDTRKLLAELARDLRWTWSGDLSDLFRAIDVELWRKVNHSPTAFLAEADEARIDAAGREPAYRERLESACGALRAYVSTEGAWAARYATALRTRPVAYFSAEFGLHESLPVYSGGLGILAGDHLKTCSDLGLPIWGVGILYRQGYFTQEIDAEGRQQERYTDLDLRRVALEPVLDSRKERLSIHLETAAGLFPIDLWQARVGRARLLLLDGTDDSAAENRNVFGLRLYGGDLRTRLLQELILGVGGYRALLSLGLRPGVLHLNEGHSAFAVLEAVAQTMEEEGLAFEEAARRVRARTVFTTHTPVSAGHDRFPPELIGEHLAPLRERLKISHETLLGLGRVNPDDAQEPFCMTVLAFRLSSHVNAVSALHRRTSRSMWQALWSGRHAPQAPITHVTNGVHVASWMAPEMGRLFADGLGAGWLERLREPETWEEINRVGAERLWEVKQELKRQLVAFVERRLGAQRRRAGLPAGGPGLDPRALIIGVARRFVEYKRANLLFAEPERLAKLLGDPARPVQIVFAGKAHPQDEHGKAILRAIFEYSGDARFQGRVFVLENHDMNMARHLVQGCDLWLNMPRRPLEACGTSGQKAVFNATLNFSTLDGWWAEAYDGSNGYAFGDGLTHADTALHDRRDVEDLYEVLESRVVPEFFERPGGGAPPLWIARVQRALATLGWRYNSERMAIDYATRCYLDAAGALTS